MVWFELMVNNLFCEEFLFNVMGGFYRFVEICLIVVLVWVDLMGW